MRKKLLLLAGVVIVSCSLMGCETRQSNVVSRNISLEADNFNMIRQLTVINCLQGDVLFQMEGKLSIYADRADNQLEVTVESEDGTYQKHFIGLSDNVTYVVEQKNYKDINNYKYSLNYNPKMWLPIELKNID